MAKKDDFWDIESLLPPKKAKPSPSGAHSFVQTVPVAVGGSKNEKAESRKISCFSGEQELFKEYAPSWNPLIHKVRVYKEKNTYRLYHIFLSDAVRYINEKGSECPYVPSYSYIPQYSQLNASQRAYYFYFRSEANRGNYIKTNQSYFLLYVYEILNLPEYIDPKIGVERLAKVWAAYRGMLSEIDKYMIVWLADYALLHEESLPEEILRPFLKDILSHSMLKECYLGGGSTLSDARLDAFITLASDYSYKKGRYVSAENGSLFLEHIEKASRIALEAILAKESKAGAFHTVSKRYPAYIGAFCAEPYRYTLEVSYTSVSGTEALRTLLTSVVKYAENKLRAALSIKSRLSVPALPPAYKEMIDDYYSKQMLPQKRTSVVKVPEYEKMYDALSLGFSSEEAKNIEESSWQNTKILIPEEEAAELFEKEQEKEAPPPAHLPISLLDMEVLALLLEKGESAAREAAQRSGTPVELAAERINEYFSDTMGDIVIEISGHEMCLIEDYRSEVAAFLAPYKDVWSKTK